MSRGKGEGFSLRDVIAGASVVLVLIPQSVAYAELAGLPPQVGLYAGALPPIAAAFFASSPYLQTGPGAPTALLTLGALLPLANRGTPEYVALAALLALVVGLTRVLVGFFRGGGVAYLMSQPVLLGFTTGAATLILASQLPGAVGITDAPADGVLQRAWWALAHVDSWQLPSVVMALATVGLILGARRISPLIPGVLIASILAIVYSVTTGYTGPTVGSVPAGFPSLALDLPWSSLPLLIVPGVVIALVGFSEAASIARTFAAEERSPWDPNREFLGQGMANLASGVSGGMPVGGSFGRSTIARMSGARSRWAGAVTGLLALAFLPFADILEPLPGAVLAAIIISAVASLMKIRPLVRLWKRSRPQALVGYSTFAFTLILSPRVDQAVLLGVLLALGVHAWREMGLKLEHWVEGDTLHIRPEGVLWFGSAPRLEADAFELLARDDGTTRIVLHLHGLGRIDYSGAVGLRELEKDADSAGVDVEFVDIPPHAERIFHRVLGWRKEEAATGAGMRAVARKQLGEGDGPPDEESRHDS